MFQQGCKCSRLKKTHAGCWHRVIWLLSCRLLSQTALLSDFVAGHTLNVFLMSILMPYFCAIKLSIYIFVTLKNQQMMSAIMNIDYTLGTREPPVNLYVSSQFICYEVAGLGLSIPSWYGFCHIQINIKPLRSICFVIYCRRSPTRRQLDREVWPVYPTSQPVRTTKTGKTRTKSSWHSCTILCRPDADDNYS